jgi:cytoskeletal protein CcmA (bactofilin family)
LGGHTLTVAEEATVSATVSANTVVEGTIKGSTAAATKIAVKPTAKLEGAFSAPSISVAEGAIVHGSGSRRRGAKISGPSLKVGARRVSRSPSSCEAQLWTAGSGKQANGL